MAAGGVRTGAETVLGEIRAGRAKLVLLSSDASDRTKKQISDKCKFYNIKLFETQYTADALASVIGKKSPCAAIALTGRGPWKNVLDSLTQTKTDVPAMNEDRKDDN